MAVPFKVMVLIPGLTEVRPVNAIPVVAGYCWDLRARGAAPLAILLAIFSELFLQPRFLGLLGTSLPHTFLIKFGILTSRKALFPMANP
jgi:energy-coupling factor transport system substrate-specific component